MSDRIWRLNNLYYIKDPDGKKILFKPNWAQMEILQNPHNFELCLKCRQIGMTTLFCIDGLDAVLWTPNFQAGIVAQTLDDASNIFKDKLKFAFDNLHPAVRALFRIVGDSAKEMAFAHGSAIRVGTSLRSSTLQLLHISEFGKICAKDPEKAREIITGSLNTVHIGQRIIIESTAEGREGRFFTMCEKAMERGNENLGDLDFKFRFFPWHRHPEYKLSYKVPIPDRLKEYFDVLYNKGIILTEEQKWWYAKKYETQQEDMTREFPSFPEEAFAASQDGYWYASQMKEIREAGHITNVSYDKALEVHTAWDLGQADFMCIWFFQINRQGEINVIDYYKTKDTALSLISIVLKEKKYNYGTHLWPHDAKARDRAGITFVDQAADLNLYGYVLESHGVIDGINKVRSTLSRCWFDGVKCKDGIKDLESYKKKWSNTIGGWSSEAYHDEASHGADAFRYLAAGISKLEGNDSIADDYKAINAYYAK